MLSTRLNTILYYFHEDIKILDETNKKSIFFFPNVGGATVFNDNLDVIEFYMFNSQLTRFLLFSGLSHRGRK